MDLRLVIEPKAARWAAERGSEASQRQILSAQQCMEAEKGSIEDFVVADALFHRAILRAAENELLRAMKGMIFSALLSSIRLTNKDPRENRDSVPFHRAAANAILARGGDLAEARMERLLANAHHRALTFEKKNAEAVAEQLLAAMPPLPVGLHPREPLFEFDTTENRFRDDLLQEPLDIQAQVKASDGFLRIPQGSGLGIEPDLDFLRSYEVA